MGRKKKPGKKKPLQPTALTKEEDCLVTSILEGYETSDPAEIVARVPDLPMARAVAERLCLGSEPSISLLLALKERFEDKQINKTIKREFFKLKQKGVVVEEPFETVDSPNFEIRLHEENKSEAFVGPILNMFGSRAVLITHFKGAKGRHVGMGLVSDEDGIHDFFYGATGKKRLTEMKDRLSENAGPMVETSLAHAATIMETAYSRHIELHPGAPTDYFELRPWFLLNIPILEHAAIYDFIPEGQLTNKIITDSQLDRLFKHGLMESWVIELARLKPFLEELIKMDDSSIILSEQQKSDQARRIRENCIENLFPETERALLKCRLEEMAYFYFKQGEEDFCRLCLDAGFSLAQEDRHGIKNPVLSYIVSRSIALYMDLAKGDKPGYSAPAGNSTSSIILA